VCCEIRWCKDKKLRMEDRRSRIENAIGSIGLGAGGVRLPPNRNGTLPPRAPAG
jgi:hypothetical protein